MCVGAAVRPWVGREVPAFGDEANEQGEMGSKPQGDDDRHAGDQGRQRCAGGDALRFGVDLNTNAPQSKNRSPSMPQSAVIV